MRKFEESYTLEESSSTNYPDYKWVVNEYNDSGSPSIVKHCFRTKKEAQKFLSEKRHEMVKLNPIK